MRMIDDVAYLNENALEDSQIISIDSTNRNKRVHFDSAEYTVTFDQPYRNVFGFEILDASIPATSYNVEPYASTLYFSRVNRKPNSLLLTDPVAALEEFKYCNSFIKIFNGYENDVSILISEISPSLTTLLNVDITPPSLILDERAAVSHPYRIYTREPINLSSDQIKAKVIQSPDTHYIFKYDGIEYAVDETNPLNTVIVSRMKQEEFVLVFDNSVSVSIGTRIPKIVIGIIFFNQKLVTQSTYNAARSSGLYEMEIVNIIRSLEPGTYDVLTLINDLNDLLNPSFVEVEATTPIPRKQGKLVFSSPTFFFFNSDRGDLIKSIGFSIYPYANIDANRDRFLPLTIGDNDFVFGAVSQGGRYRIFAPGLVSLLGERFLILRIPEIETHLYGSFAYNQFTPGLGMFKNAASFGAITNLRFDFVTAPKKHFHPIGKLSKITIRFETATGRLYDFKGVNHQIMAQIKYYVPYKKKMNFIGSILNPEYDPDVRMYMTNKRHMEQREDSGDEENFAEDENEVSTYKQRMEQFVSEIENDEYEEEDDEYEEEDDSEEYQTSDA